MKSTIRHAVLAIAAALAMVPTVRADGPAAFAQVEIRGLDALFAATDRIAAPYVPAGQAKGMFIGACEARGINPFEVVDGGETVRFLVCEAPNYLLDIPAAGGDASAVLEKLAGALGAVDTPKGVDMPEGAHFLRTGLPANARSLFIPRGGRLVAIDYTKPNPIPPAQALALLDATPDVPAEGVLASTIDFEALKTVWTPAPEDSSATGFREILADPDFPFRAVAFGLGLDGADRFRADFSAAYIPDVPQARIVSGIGAPVSPLANAILFPDAVAAATCRQELSVLSDDELRSFLSGDTGDDDPRIAAADVALTAACLPLLRLLGDEYAIALLPADDGEEAGSAALLAFPADPQTALDGVPAILEGGISAFAGAFAAIAEEDGDDVPDVAVAASRIRIEPVGERTVQGTPVRRYTFRLEGEGNDSARDLGFFEAAAAGPALYLGTLPDGRLGDVLADLAAGHTAKGPVAAMPSFAAAYGEAPEGAACGYVRLRPALRAILPALRNLMRAMGADEIELKDLVNPVSFALSLDGHPYLPDVTLASTQRWLPDGNRLESIVSMPLADLHAAIDAVVTCHRRACEIIGAHGAAGR
ncbi:MAG: hypothetical protein IKO01_02195 [Kiritimatiellae bacterium]|nr:hypothetical protein [Kiritimatiellia bacterium]